MISEVHSNRITMTHKNVHNMFVRLLKITFMISFNSLNFKSLDTIKKNTTPIIPPAISFSQLYSKNIEDNKTTNPDETERIKIGMISFICAKKFIFSNLLE